MERRARTSIGWTMLRAKALSRNFQMIGTLLSQQMWETKALATSTEGRETPMAFKLEESLIAHRNGSLPFCWADWVSSTTLSTRLGCTESAIAEPDRAALWCSSSLAQPDRAKNGREERERETESLLIFTLCLVAWEFCFRVGKYSLSSIEVKLVRRWQWCNLAHVLGLIWVY